MEALKVGLQFTGKNGKLYMVIDTKQGKVIEVNTGKIFNYEEVLKRSQSISNNIKGEWVEVEENEVLELRQYIICSGVAYLNDSKEIEFIYGIESNEPFIIRVIESFGGAEQILLCQGINSKVIWYLNNLEKEQINNIMSQCGMHGHYPAYTNGKLLITFGEYPNVKEIRDERKAKGASLKSKLLNKLNNKEEE